MLQTDWVRKAENLLKAELARDGIQYRDLALRLNALGVNENAGTVASKINRGKFSFFFFLQCMKALGRDEIRFDK